MRHHGSALRPILCYCLLATACDERETNPVQPSFSEISQVIPDGRIAFVTTRDAGNFEIYVMAPDGTGQANLSNYPGPDFQPAWSPDGTRIAFSRIDETGAQNVWLMNADGSNQHPLNSVDGGDPAWSPDGSRIAFTSFVTGGPNLASDLDVMVMNADGSGVLNLTNNPAADASPSWSPDGTRIAFMSNRESPSLTPNVYVMNADGTGVHKVTDLAAGAWPTPPRWSPDGAWILFVGSPGLYLVRPDGTDLHRLLNFAKRENDAAWSPDGNYIAFSAGSAFKRFDVYRVRIDGTDLLQLTDIDGFNANVNWGR